MINRVHDLRRIRRALGLVLLLIVFAAGDPIFIATADAIDKPTGKTTDPRDRGGKLPPGKKTGGQVSQCSQSYCEGVIKDLGWKCSSVGAVLKGGGYCECQCKDQGGAVTNSKTTSPQVQQSPGAGGYKP